MNVYHAIGIMSGTSLDGLDIVYCKLFLKKRWQYEILKCRTISYTKKWKEQLINAHLLKSRDFVLLDHEFGKFIGKDNFGNKYYQSKNGKRWVIYSEEIDASKIPVEWFSWIHFMPNKIENTHDFKKHQWQKPHKPNLTGTDSAYHPNKNKKDAIEKKYKSWK